MQGCVAAHRGNRQGLNVFLRKKDFRTVNKPLRNPGLAEVRLSLLTFPPPAWVDCVAGGGNLSSLDSQLVKLSLGAIESERSLVEGEGRATRNNKEWRG